MSSARFRLVFKCGVDAQYRIRNAEENICIQFFGTTENFEKRHH